MRNRFTKFAAAAAPAALLLAAGTPADAKVLVMGDGGWEVSFDGSVNGFLVLQDTDKPPVVQGAAGAGAGSFAAFYGGDGNRQNIVGATFAPDPLDSSQDPSSARVRTGLLPAVFAINIKAPTVNGLDMASRIGFYPQINNANRKNQFRLGTDGIQAGAQIDLREIFFTVDGSFGQVMVGRTLSQFLGKNILTDMTLFGVGVQGGVGGAGTTLGRIGYGYVYPNFNARIQYTTPDMNGFKVSAGMYDPSALGSGCAGASTITCASETDTPRFEGEATYAGSFSGADVSLWINGLWQDANFVGGPQVAGTATRNVGKSITSWGFGGGLQVSYAGFEFTGSGYTGEALGTTLMLDTNSVDLSGQERNNYGFIAQGTYTFAGTTKVGVSYGGSRADETSNEEACRVNGPTGTATITATSNGTACTGAGSFAAAGVPIEKQDAFTAGVYHNVNPNLLLVAEYTREDLEWHDGRDMQNDIFSVGGFFFW